MTARPCTGCGDIIATGSRCRDCRPADTRVRKDKGQAAYDPTWRKLSVKARRMSPFCQDCGAVEDLTADHVLPKSDYPELVHALDNLAVRCRSCNSRRGATGFTDREAGEVLTRLHASYRRRPTRAGRERIAAAERALTTRGDTPNAQVSTPVGKPQGAMKLTGVKT